MASSFFRSAGDALRRIFITVAPVAGNERTTVTLTTKIFKQTKRRKSNSQYNFNCVILASVIQLLNTKKNHQYKMKPVVGIDPTYHY